MLNAEHNLMAWLHASDVRDIATAEISGIGLDGDACPGASAKDIYFGLLKPQPDESIWASSRDFLSARLDSVAATAADLPDEADGLLHWMQSSTAAVATQYQRYVAERQSGAPRRYFPAKSHALHFLKGVAPTKLVDGAWLYGVVSQWRDLRCAELIRIYLEELGEGEPDKNHVVIYRKLLAAHECEGWETLSDSHFVQGAIQLALAQHASDFLPEVIGFNLGYEQLPLHLLICAHELNELGIDPYYFTLHVTVDNAASGHAARAVRSVHDAMPRLGDRRAFYRRVRNGYQLNSLGASTNSVIAQFDLEQALFDILADKAGIGAALHSDYCRVAGKTVREWLSTRGAVPEFVKTLEKTDWIRRHQDPHNSRFWNLLEGEKAQMWGVFNRYERQVIYDWIAGDTLDAFASGRTWRTRQMRQALAPPADPGEAGLMSQRSQMAQDVRPGTRYGHSDGSRHASDFASESRLLRERLGRAPNKDAAMDLLVPWLSPVHHHTEAGLLATRLFAQQLRDGC